MTSDPATPSAWGIFLSRAWGRQFPVDVSQIALEYSKRFDDPILAVKEAPVGGGFEGALYPLNKRKGWAILYNPQIPHRGRINFTRGHELGHYLCHRRRSAQGFECSEQRVLGYDPSDAVRVIEREADVFASYVLMPIDDYREQIKGQAMSLDLLDHCRDRYDVSITAAALKWVDFTPERAVLVYADNGFVLWARRSDAAKKQGVFFPKGMALPTGSLAASRNASADPTGAGHRFGPGVWARYQGGREFTIFADRYEATISLLIMDEREWKPRDDEEEAEDTFDRLQRPGR